MSDEKRKLPRRNFSYYMRVLDESTGKLVGHISDISTGGFKLDSKEPLPLNMMMRLRIDQIDSTSSKSYLIFTAKVKWCEPDRFEPNMYNLGLQIVDMSSSTLVISFRTVRINHRRNFFICLIFLFST